MTFVSVEFDINFSVVVVVVFLWGGGRKCIGPSNNRHALCEAFYTHEVSCSQHVFIDLVISSTYTVPKYMFFFFLSVIFFFFSVLAALSTSLLITVNVRSWTLLCKSLSQTCLAEHRLRDSLARRRLWVAHNCQTHIYLFSLLFSLSSSFSFIRCFSLVDLSPFSLQVMFGKSVR